VGKIRDAPRQTREEMSFEGSAGAPRRNVTGLTLQALEDTHAVGSALLLLFATPPCVHLTEPLAAVLPRLRTKAVPGALLPQPLSLLFLEDLLRGAGPQIRHVLVLDQRAPDARERADGMQETEGGEIGVVWGVVEGGHECRSVEEARGMRVGDEEGLDEGAEEVGVWETGGPIAIHEASWTNISERILG
jgi:hypothetical protein